MSETILLKEAVDYSNLRINKNDVTLENFVTTDNILQNKLGLKNAINLPPQDGNMPAFNTDNILVANIRPYLKKIWFADRVGGCSADVLVFNVKKEFHPKFIYYAMFRDDFFNHMMRGAKGTKMPRGDKLQILGFSIPKFDSLSQQKIAAVLSSLDEKIELNNRINSELEAIAKMLYDYWFVQFDFPDKNGKPYKSSGGKMVYNKELKREIPEGWEVNYIENVLEKNITTKKIPSRNLLSKGKIPVIDQSTNFICGYTNDIDTLIKINKPHIIFGDHTRILKLINFPFARGADGTQILLSKIDRLPQYLFYYSLLKIDLSNYGYARHYKFLKQSKILLPKINIASKFDKVIEGNYEMIKHNIFQNKQLTQLRDWLLPMLMNGQASVN